VVGTGESARRTLHEALHAAPRQQLGVPDVRARPRQEHRARHSRQEERLVTINDRILVAQDSDLLPNSTLSLEKARHQLGMRHLMMEQLTKGERSILYAAESLLRYVDHLREECVRIGATRDHLSRDLSRLRGCIEGSTVDEMMQNINQLRADRSKAP
jgi:hypothetical protein